MDPVCHTLAGAALAEAGLKKRTPLALAALVAAANVPDVDVLVYATDVLPMYVRRGWTHGPVGLALLPPLVAGLVWSWDRLVRQRRASPPPPAAWRGLLLVSYLGALSHPLLDFLNSYGIRLLFPFSDRWFYGDALYIVDPWLTAMLGGAVLVARRRASARAARAGLAAAAAYAAVMLASNLAARAAVRAGLDRAGVSADARFMVTPVFGNPLAREVLVDLGARYEKGFVWFAPLPRFRPAGYGLSTGRDDPAVQAAAASPRGRQFLAWARFPFAAVDRIGGRTIVHLNDARYAGEAREGWARVSIDVTQQLRAQPR